MTKSPIALCLAIGTCALRGFLIPPELIRRQNALNRCSRKARSPGEHKPAGAFFLADLLGWLVVLKRRKKHFGLL